MKQGRRKTNKLLTPYILVILLFIPIVIYEYIPGTSKVWGIFKYFFIISMWIWGSVLVYVHIGVYIVVSLIYLIILLVIFFKKEKRLNIYHILFIILCFFSILLYFKGGVMAKELAYSF